MSVSMCVPTWCECVCSHVCTHVVWVWCECVGGGCLFPCVYLHGVNRSRSSNWSWSGREAHVSWEPRSCRIAMSPSAWRLWGQAELRAHTGTGRHRLGALLGIVPKGQGKGGCRSPKLWGTGVHLRWGQRVVMAGSLEAGPQGSPAISLHRLGSCPSVGGRALGQDDTRPQPLSPCVPARRGLIQ